MGAAGEKAQNAKEAAKERAEQMKESAQSGAEQAKEKSQEGASTIGGEKLLPSLQHRARPLQHALRARLLLARRAHITIHLSRARRTCPCPYHRISASCRCAEKLSQAKESVKETLGMGEQEQQKASKAA